MLEFLQAVTSRSLSLRRVVLGSPHQFPAASTGMLSPLSVRGTQPSPQDPLPTTQAGSPLTKEDSLYAAEDVTF